MHPSLEDNELKVLVVGNGAREHTLCWKLAQSPRIGKLLIAPGNAGTDMLGTNVEIDADDVQNIVNFVIDHEIDFTVIGPEVPLALGLADMLLDNQRAVFGPTMAAAQIESKKSFAKEMMSSNDIPTGKAEIFSDYNAALRHLERITVPIVIKADGLAAGKGVQVAHTRREAISALQTCMVKREFGTSGETVLIEEYLSGPEISVFAFVDGQDISSMVAACDYKLSGDGDTGSNTGGMGAYSPPIHDLWNSKIETLIRDSIMEPTVRALVQNGTPYTGILYAGLMLTTEGPKVIEFNCRLGDPEAQVVLPRLKNDLLDVMISTVFGEIGSVKFEWDKRTCVGVVITSGGYPENYKTGYPISGLDSVDTDTMVFHAGTNLSQNGVVTTSGGRVLTVVTSGEDIYQARTKTYSNVKNLKFIDSYHRTDIGLIP